LNSGMIGISQHADNHGGDGRVVTKTDAHGLQHRGHYLPFAFDVMQANDIS